jgi:hypothetical protein
LQRRRQVVHPPYWLDADGEDATGAFSKGGLDAVDDGGEIGVADRRFVVLRDGPRFVIFGTRK